MKDIPILFSIKVAAWVAATLVSLLSANPALAGGVTAGMIETSAITDLVCGADVAVQLPDQPLTCQVAKFQECSSCATALVKNDSASKVTVKNQVSGPGFGAESPGPFILGCLKNVPTSATQSGCDSSLAPGETCYQTIQFCPEKAGLSRGVVHITLRNADNQRELTYSLAGPANYPREEQTADDVRVRHLPELMSIPDVKRVSLDHDGNDAIAINLEVMNVDRIAAVQKIAPKQLEGVPVIVSQFAYKGNAL